MQGNSESMEGYARVLQAVQDTGKEGGSVEEIISNVKKMSGENHTPDTAIGILRTLEHKYCIKDLYGDEKVWQCTAIGDYELSQAHEKIPNAFKVTTSPSVPMHL